ncbi:MAG: HNH endonuclease [Lacipirellulaceae bacterium]
MALRPLECCREPLCTELARGPYCDAHARTRHAGGAKNAPGDPFYASRPWRRVRGLVLSREPLCRHCAARGVITAASVVDHVTPRRERPDMALSTTNLQPLCGRCHNRKTGQGQ